MNTQQNELSRKVTSDRDIRTRQAQVRREMDAALIAAGRLWESSNDPQHSLPSQEAEMRYKQAIDLYDQGKYHEVLSFLEQALSLDRDNPYLWYIRGNTHHALREYRKAAVAYLWALRRAPYFSDAAVNLGVIYELLGYYEKSLSLYDRAVQLDPENGYVLYNRGNALAMMGRLTEAVASFDRAIELLPTFADSFLNRGHVLSRLGRNDEALEDYRRALLFKPQDSNTLWCLAWANFGKDGLTVGDVQKLEKISCLDPQHYTSPLCLGVVALSRGNLEVAMARFEQAQNLQPQEWDPHFWIGVATALSSEAEIAQRAIELALDLGLPPMFLTPLYWLRSTCPAFYEAFAQGVLTLFGM